MPTPSDYRAKAIEYSQLSKTADNADDARQFREREQSFTTLADNEQWLLDHREAAVHPGKEPKESKTTEEEKDASEGGRQQTQ